jgi:hypothetical protein
MKQLDVDRNLVLCPICGNDLKFGNIKSNIETTCENCLFREQPGSLHINTLFSKTISEYCLIQGIKQWDYNDTAIPVAAGMQNTALLPLIAQRSNELSLQQHVFGSITSQAPLFTCIKDINAWTRQRVTLDSATQLTDNLMFGFTMEVIKFTAVVSEAMGVGKELGLPQDTLYAKTIIQDAPIAPLHDIIKPIAPQDQNNMELE